MITALTYSLYAGCVVVALIAAHHYLRERLVDNAVMIPALLLELGLLVQLVVGIVRSGAIADGGERLTFIAYLPTILLILPVALFVAIKEKTRWSMAVVIGGGLVVAVLVARLVQIWSLNVPA